MSDKFILNRNPGGRDVLHKQHGDERCNRDDMTGRQTIDADTADALLALDEVDRCGHCYSEEGDSA